MFKTQSKRMVSGLAAAGLLSGALLGGPLMMAQAQAGPFEVIAKELDNPRGMAFGTDGALYVAEAGRGGTGPCMTVMRPEPVQNCYGPTGAVTRIANGKQERIITGLPSLMTADGREVTGPHDLLPNGAHPPLVLMGLGANPTLRRDLGVAGAFFGQLIRLDETGPVSLGDLAAAEAKLNPDGQAFDSNPFAVATSGGNRLVVDAGGNALLSIRPNGRVDKLAIFPTREVTAPAFLKMPAGAKMPMQSVPTALTVGSNGTIYVGELTGFPFPPKSARVFKVTAGREPQVYAEGFTNIIDLALGRDGSLYVLEIATNGLTSEKTGGALIRIAPDGKRTTIASDGLVMPTNVAVGPDGALYVANFGVMPGKGEVVRIKP